MAIFGGRPGVVEIAGGVATLTGVLIVTASRAGLLGRAGGSASPASARSPAA
jgi:hypothetical protein